MERYLELERQDLGHRLDPEVLLSFGGQAARAHVEKGMPLTDAVLTVVQGRALNPAHVCRIVETANQQAYLLIYDSLPGPSRAVSFEGGPARIFEILDRVFPRTADAAPPGEEQVIMERPRSPDYGFAPASPAPLDVMPKAASVATPPVTEGDIYLDKMPPAKVAEVLGRAWRSPGGHVALYHTLKSASDNGRQDVGARRARLTHLADDLSKLASQALKEGHTPAEVARVMLDKLGEGVQDRWLVAKATLSKIGAEIPDPRSLPWGRTATPQHELTVKTAEMIRIAQEVQEMSTQLAAVDRELAEVRRRLGARS